MYHLFTLKLSDLAIFKIWNPGERRKYVQFNVRLISVVTENVHVFTFLIFLLFMALEER